MLDIPWEEFYNKCYSVLVKDARASESMRLSFINAMMDDRQYHECYEFRFCGDLGFGGKFWRYDGKVSISCYPEDLTPDRKDIIDIVNKKLINLQEEYVGMGIFGPPKKHVEHIINVMSE